ncbi:hypothetical protein HNQ77_003059 [Silvibacterium bohemicum]|uniref:Uncharacterized protein n=1 Tax=Silvibacterium bohemicum TaxID=1577686 RepID=A0A841K1Q0_9BACT|nr:hypothetical protein [Silvibacterium bohemicum]MBB6145101.1 hypothetical protein [Silvibacterium bohemicum]
MQTLEPSTKAAPGFVSRLDGVLGAEMPINTDDVRWQLALRIAASGSLGRSGLLSDFLLYIVGCCIRGRTEDITEQRIGVTVFGRAEDYDPNDDNIVRSYARKLRKRIEEYFATEGREETLRLEIPRGGYTPIFSDVVPPSPRIDESAVSEEIEAQESETTKSIAPEKLEIVSAPVLGSSHHADGHFRISLGMIVALLAGLLIGAGITLLKHSRLMESRQEMLSHVLWSQLFSRNQDTFIVPSDDGLVIMQRLIPRPVPLTEYVNGTYRTPVKTDAESDTKEILKLGGRRFTSVVDLGFAVHLAELKEVIPERTMVRYAHDLRMDDLRAGNAILIGSDEANPWIELFRPQLHFRFRFDPDPDKPSGFVNLYPRRGEAALYTTKGQEEQTYGIIAYLPNLTNTGHVLIVAGLNTAGTEAAATFLLDPTSMMPTLQRARTADGNLQPFELLLGAGNVAANASTPTVVLERIGLPSGH